MIRATLIALAITLSACAGTQAAKSETAATGPEASIPFADLGGIRSFRTSPDRTLLLEGQTGRWYQATFFGTCLDVPYAEAIGVDSGIGGRVDRFSAVIVRGQRCPFRSLIEIPDPDARPAAATTAPPQN